MTAEDQQRTLIILEASMQGTSGSSVGSDFARNRKIALVAVHGISPTQRYEIQDLVASQLRQHLQGASGQDWISDVFFPTVNQEPGAAQAYASALRIYQQADDKVNPQRTVFDVYEGYWSPIDKNRTSLRAVLSWLLKSLFIPLNNQTRVPATRSKIAFDLGYTALAMAALLLTGALALASAFFTYAWLSASAGMVTTVSGGDVIGKLATAPWTLGSGLTLATIGALLLCAIGGYLIVQVLVSFISLARHRAPPSTSDAKEGQTWRTWTRIALLLLGGVMIWAGCYLVFKDRPADLWYARLLPLGFVLAAFFFRGYLSLAIDFFVNRLGDVQIYTTRDNNSAFFSLREQILEAVEKTVLQVLRTNADAPTTGRAYERIYVLGHSLGSTIAMDVLIRMHQLVEGGTLDENDWRRIRGLVTFGTSLEKTRFFFDVQNPTLSQEYQQWRDDVDGHLFTDAFADLAKPTPPKTQNLPIGIFWANYWYEQDIVANRVITYKSSIPAGQPIVAAARLAQERVVCLNVELRSTFSWLHHQWVHSDYLLDDRFWSGVGSSGSRVVGLTEILTS